MSGMATSTPMTVASEKTLKYVFCVYCLMQFQKDLSKTKALIDLGSEINTICPAYTKKLGLRIWKTNVKVQKIDGSSLNTFGIVIAGFQIEDKLERVRFFQETFLVADIRMDIVFGIPFFTLSNADLWFAEKKLT